jgi:hypothetical protein
MASRGVGWRQQRAPAARHRRRNSRSSAPLFPCASVATANGGGCASHVNLARTLQVTVVVLHAESDGAQIHRSPPVVGPVGTSRRNECGRRRRSSADSSTEERTVTGACYRVAFWAWMSPSAPPPLLLAQLRLTMAVSSTHTGVASIRPAVERTPPSSHHVMALPGEADDAAAAAASAQPPRVAPTNPCAR